MPISKPSPGFIVAIMEHSICRRAFLMHMLLTGYSLFESIQTKKKCANIKFTYKQAEELAYLVGNISDMEVSPSLFLHDENQLANELLDEYEKHQALLKNYDETIRKMANAFYHHLYYCHKMVHSESHCLLIALTAFLNYAQGTIDKYELKNGFIAIDLRRMKTKVIDSMYARKELIQLEREFNEICIKQASRTWRKTHEEPFSNFTIHMSI